MAKPCTPTYTAQRVQLFKPKTGNGNLSLGGFKGGYSLSRKRVSPFIRAAPSAALPAAPVPQLPLHLCEKEKKGNKKPPPGEARASCCVVCVFLGGRKSHRGELPFASIKIPVNLG